MIYFVIFVSSRTFKVNIQHQSQAGASLTTASFNSLHKDYCVSLRVDLKLTFWSGAALLDYFLFSLRSDMICSPQIPSCTNAPMLQHSHNPGRFAPTTRGCCCHRTDHGSEAAQPAAKSCDWRSDSVSRSIQDRRV